MAPQTQRQELNVKASINTDSIQEDTRAFNDGAAPLLQQTGIERNGGVTNLYETEIAMPANSVNYVAPNGQLISRLAAGDVLVDNLAIGLVSPYGVQIRDVVPNVDDVIASTIAKTYITCTIQGNAITVSEYWTKNNLIVTQNIPTDPLFPSLGLKPDVALLPSGVASLPIHRRVITFPGLSTTLYTSLSFVRSSSVNWYNTNFKFALRQGDSVKILQEQFPATILTIPDLLAGYNELNYLMAYQFENSAYFINLAGNSNNQSFICDSGFTAITQTLYCKYAVPQVSLGKSRMLISCDPILHTTGVYSLGYVGYYDFVNFIATVQWVGTTNGSVAGYAQPLVYNTGYGYSEYTQEGPAGNYYNFNSPAYDYNSSIQYNFRETQNTNTLYNYYGKFTNIYTLAPSVPFEFRVCWVNGVQSYLSVALYDNFPSDHLGVMLTELGSFDDTYTPLIAYDNTIIYKYGNNYYIIVVDVYTESTIPQIQQISSSAFKINTISPTNIVDLPSKTLLIGSCDYNGRMGFNSTGALSVVKTRLVSSYSGKYSNGIDGGEKLVDITSPTLLNMEVIGYRVDGLQSFQIDTYIAPTTNPSGTPIYSFSTTATGAELTDPQKTDTLYIQNVVIPLALGDTYNLNVASTFDSTVFYNTTNPVSVGSAVVAGTSIGYDGYTLGNDIPGIYAAFRLQGQQYLQDDVAIYKVDLFNNNYQGKTTFCPSNGAKYIASSPTTIYFLSTFDNSLYTFTGGSVLDKAKRMNSLENILNGIWSIRENSLLLNTANTFVWVRDGVISLNNKKSNQLGTIFLYETAKGLIITNNSYSWQYSYTDPTIVPVPANTAYNLVPMHLQTAFFGLENNLRCIIPEWVVTIYNPDRTKASLIFNNYVQDSDGGTKTDQRYININPQDYTEGGYSRQSFKPKFPAAIRSSFSIDTAEKIQIQSIVVSYQAADEAVVGARRSR